MAAEKPPKHKKLDPEEFTEMFGRITKPMFFDQIPREEVETFRTILNEKEKHYPCPWIDKFLDNPETFWLYITDPDTKIYGAIVFDEDEDIFDIPCYYIRTRCTFDRLDVITSGRLLWAYTLNYIATYHDNNFIVWNRTTADAKGYHKKMKMVNYETALAEFVGNQIPDKGALLQIAIDHTANMSNEPDDDVRRANLIEDIESPNGMYLFFRSNPAIDYDDLETAYKYIITGGRKSKRKRYKKNKSFKKSGGV